MKNKFQFFILGVLTLSTGLILSLVLIYGPADDFAFSILSVTMVVFLFSLTSTYFHYKSYSPVVLFHEDNEFPNEEKIVKAGEQAEFKFEKDQFQYQITKIFEVYPLLSRVEIFLGSTLLGVGVLIFSAISKSYDDFIRIILTVSFTFLTTGLFLLIQYSNTKGNKIFNIKFEDLDEGIGFELIKVENGFNIKGKVTKSNNMDAKVIDFAEIHFDSSVWQTLQVATEKEFNHLANIHRLGKVIMWIKDLFARYYLLFILFTPDEYEYITEIQIIFEDELSSISGKYPFLLIKSKKEEFIIEMKNRLEDWYKNSKF